MPCLYSVWGSVILEAAEGRAEEAVFICRWEGRGEEQQSSWVREMLSLRTCESRRGPVQTQLVISWCLICTGLHCAVFELIIKEKTQLLHMLCKLFSVPTFAFTSLQHDFKPSFSPAIYYHRHSHHLSETLLTPEFCPRLHLQSLLPPVS